jgi:hypothetical protein
MPLTSLAISRKRLDRIFDQAIKVARTYMDVELPVAILADVNVWATLCDHCPNLALPATNTTSARQMRTVALVACLGLSLSHHIFTPLYVPYDGMQIFWCLLIKLAARDHSKEAYLRSVLLRMFSPDQSENIDGLTEDVGKEIGNVFLPLVVPEKRSAFVTAIRELSELALEEWLAIQKLEDKVVPVTRSQDRPPSHWKFVNMNSGAKPSQSNGNTPGPSTRPSSRPDPEIDITVCDVWPNFVVIRKDGEDLVRQGYMLSRSQMLPARQEKAKQQPTAPLGMIGGLGRNGRRSSLVAEPFL